MDFLAEYEKLKKFHPHVPIPKGHSFENCDYGDYIHYSKNCYFCFDCSHSSNCLYVFDVHKSVDCVDCSNTSFSELCYECVDTYKSYNSTYLENCGRMQDSHFCAYCNHCRHCFGCLGLRNKKYCIFNRQLTKKDYFKKLKKLQVKKAKKILVQIEKFKKSHSRIPQHESDNKNCDYGDYIYHSKNCYFCFDVTGSEDSGYLFDSTYCRNSFNLTKCHQCELCYECVESAFLYSCNFVTYASKLADCEYCYYCVDCQHCFGCVGLWHKRYCILNRQFKKEDYFQKVEEIKDGFFGRV